MDHFNLIQNMFKRDKNKKNLENKKHPGFITLMVQVKVLEKPIQNLVLSQVN